MSTRRVDDLIKALGCDGISSSQVSRICEQLDEVVDSFLGRPLDGGPYPYVWLDGLTQKVREGGRIVKTIGSTEAMTAIKFGSVVVALACSAGAPSDETLGRQDYTHLTVYRP